MHNGYYDLSDGSGFEADGTTAKILAGLGDRLNVKGAGYIYIKAGAAIAAYACCHVSAAQVALEITTTLMGTVLRPTLICVPQYSLASGEYGWAWCGPGYLREDRSTTFKVLAANAATSVRLYTTGTAGVLDDAVTDGLVTGLALTETVTTQEAADCVAVQQLTGFCQRVTGV